MVSIKERLAAFEQKAAQSASNFNVNMSPMKSPVKKLGTSRFAASMSQINAPSLDSPSPDNAAPKPKVAASRAVASDLNAVFSNLQQNGPSSAHGAGAGQPPEPDASQSSLSLDKLHLDQEGGPNECSSTKEGSVSLLGDTGAGEEDTEETNLLPPVDQEEHAAGSSDQDSFQMDEILVGVGAGSAPTYTADSSFASFEDQMRLAREREAKRLAAEKNLKSNTDATIASLKDRKNKFMQKGNASMPNLSYNSAFGNDKDKEDSTESSSGNVSSNRFHNSARTFVSPVRVKDRQKALFGNRTPLKAPIIDEDEPLKDEEAVVEIQEIQDPDDDDDDDHDNNNNDKNNHDDNEESMSGEDSGALVANPPCLVNQELSFGASYTGDDSFASFEDQVRIARKREMERRKQEAAAKMGGSGISLKDRMKAFGK